MGATSEERTGLQRAIQKALEKEGVKQKKSQTITYVAKYRINGKLYTLRSTNAQAFKLAVQGLKKTNPKLPVTFFKVSENHV